MSIFQVHARTVYGPQAHYGSRALFGRRAPDALQRSHEFRVFDDPRVFDSSRTLLILLVLALLFMSTLAQAEAASDVPRIDLNRATAEELAALPGIGAAKAAAIVEYRASSGAFASIEDLEAVRGIGPALVAKLRPLVKLGSSGGSRGQAGAATKNKPKPGK